MVSDGIGVLYSRASSPVDFGFNVYPYPGTVPETVFASETLSLQKRDEFRILTSKILAIYQKTAVISTEFKLMIRDTGQSVL